MRRWQQERPLMVKRWRREWEIHNRDFGQCHCGLGIGTMRKHKPLEGHGRFCGVCAVSIMEAHMKRRRERYDGKRQIRAELTV